MSLDPSTLRTIVQEVFLLKTSFKTAGGSTAQTFFHGVRTAGQTSLFSNLQLTMILKLKVKPGWVSVLKSTMSFWTQKRPLTAWVFWFVTNCHHKNEHVEVTKCPLFVEELLNADEFWIKRAQAQAYSDDLTRLAAGKEVHCSSDLRSLYPFTDKKGILHVGGRPKHVPIPYQAKHPAILPKKHDIVPLILLHLHQRLNHSGVEHILAELRQRYWIPKENSQVMPCLQKTQCQTRSTAHGKPAPKQTSSFHPALLQHWCGLFWSVASQRKKIHGKAVRLSVHLPCDEGGTPRSCSLT